MTEVEYSRQRLHLAEEQYMQAMAILSEGGPASIRSDFPVGFGCLGCMWLRRLEAPEAMTKYMMFRRRLIPVIMREC